MSTTTKKYSFHMQVSVPGALKNWSDDNWEGVMTDTATGRTLSPSEVKTFLEDHLTRGHTVIPCCSPAECPDFDYFGGGCPKHPNYDLEVIATFDSKQPGAPLTDKDIFTITVDDQELQSEAEILNKVMDSISDENRQYLVKLSYCLYDYPTLPVWLTRNGGNYYFATAACDPSAGAGVAPDMLAVKLERFQSNWTPGVERIGTRQLFQTELAALLELAKQAGRDETRQGRAG